MDRKKRNIETRLFDLRFFTDLSPVHKLFYVFIYLNCSNVGIYEHNPKLAEFAIGRTIDLDKFISEINKNGEQVIKLSEGVIWIKNFVSETCKKVSATNPFGRHIFEELYRHKLLGRFIREFPGVIIKTSFDEAINEGKIQAPDGWPNFNTTYKNGVSNKYETLPDPIDIDISINKGIGTDSLDKSIKSNIPEIAEKICNELYPGNAPYFEEQITIEDALTTLTAGGLSLPEAETEIRAKFAAKKAQKKIPALSELMSGSLTKNTR